jgi:small subunit ribosomal protein S3e
VVAAVLISPSLYHHRACYGVLRFIMENKALGCEVTVSGKLRAQRAKSMKFRDGYMIKAGQPTKDFIDVAVRHVLLRQGVLGVRVAIMLPWDPTVRGHIPRTLPDVVKIHEPKEEAVHPIPDGAKGYGEQISQPANAPAVDVAGH